MKTFFPFLFAVLCVALCFQSVTLSRACYINCPNGMRKLFSLMHSYTCAIRKSFLLVLIFQFGLIPFLFSNLNAQVYNGDPTLSTQADVDVFNYTSVTGRLVIKEQTTGEILNLDGLSELTTVGGGLFIEKNSALTNIDGLANLTSIGDGLDIENNFALTNVDGLSKLTTIGSVVLLLNNASLTNVDGLSHLTSLGVGSNDPGLNVSGNQALTNLDGFSNTKGGLNFLALQGNNHLTNIGGLSNLSVTGSLEIENNPLLTNIDGLSKVSGLFFTMTIKSNKVLGNLNGLSNLTTVGGICFIAFNPALTNFDGLSKLVTVGAHFNITANGALANIDGLSSLTTVGGNFGLANDSLITNLNGLSKLKSVSNNLGIINNPALTDFCGLYNLFHSGTIGGNVDIRNNGANPVNVNPPQNVTVNADQGACSAVISSVTIGTATSDGCLVPVTITHTDFPLGNIFPVGVTSITWNATDAIGDIASAAQTITVVDNQPPTISCPANMTVSCASDVPAVDVTSVTASDNCSAIVTHVGDVITNQTCANRFTLTRTYKATDPAGNFTTCDQVITVHDNSPPTLTGLTPSQSVLWPPNHTMRDIALSYTATDNCVTNLSTTVSISSNEPVNGTGDGDTDPDWEIVDSTHIRLRAERAANGNGRIYTITVTVSDGCNAPVSASTSVMVTHNITGPLSGKPFKIGSTVDFLGEFWDKPTNIHTAKWLIDGNTSVKGIVTEPTATKNGSVTGSYKFNNTGVYKLQMNLTDQTGNITYANTNGDLEEIVVVYDPSGGYLVGGGWYGSPAGSFAAKNSLTGKVSFGFAMSYFKNATYPKGETQFEFKVGGLEFNATNFNYLAISGPKAQFKGSGKIIGDAASYNFILTVIDGQAIGGGGVDKVRMKIYNKNTGVVIYDNQMGASDAADPTTAVGAGSTIAIVSTGGVSGSTEIGEHSEERPTQFALFQSYPNPFNPKTRIDYAVPVDAHVSIRIYNTLGQIIATLVEENQSAGNRTVEFDGDMLPSGMYFYKLTAIPVDGGEPFIKVMKSVLMK